MKIQSTLSICVLLLIFLVNPIFSDIWKSCGSSSDTFEIGNVTISPDPPVKGQQVTIYADGVLKQDITAGTADITVKMGFITIIKESKPICSSINPIPCPITAGPYNHSYSVNIPNEVPKGKYDAVVKLTDQINREILCVQVDIQF